MNSTSTCANFCLSVKRKDGEDYEPSSLRGFISSFNRFLKKQKYPVCILDGNVNEFYLARKCL